MTSKPNSKIRPVILCGGQGTRLWPVSRTSFPKQFTRLFSENSLLQETVAHVRDNTLFKEPFFIGSQEQEHLLRRHLKEIGLDTPNLLLEPEGRNTAAAIASICHMLDPTELVLVLPSDHKLNNVDQFHSDICDLEKAVRATGIGIFGIQPKHPSTDFGYIQVDNSTDKKSKLFTVRKFKEKPDIERAKKFLQDGTHYWNAGIFLFRNFSMLKELDQFAPVTVTLSKQAIRQGKKRENTCYLDSLHFSKIPALPIDIAVMEKTRNGKMLKAGFDWLDIGSWQSFSDLCEEDENGNNITGNSNAVLEECRGNLIHTNGKFVAAIGLEDHAIIDTDDALLVMPKDKARDLSPFVKGLQLDGVSQALDHRKVRRPWGTYEGIHKGENHQVKHIVVKPGEKLSFQYHHHRSEYWVIVKGAGIVTLGVEDQPVQENELVFIPAGRAHRLHNPHKEELHLIEVQFGDYLGEDDIVRLDDIYGRAGEEHTHEEVN